LHEADRIAHGRPEMTTREGLQRFACTATDQRKVPSPQSKLTQECPIRAFSGIDPARMKGEIDRKTLERHATLAKVCLHRRRVRCVQRNDRVRGEVARSRLAQSEQIGSHVALRIAHHRQHASARTVRFQRECLLDHREQRFIRIDMACRRSCRKRAKARAQHRVGLHARIDQQFGERILHHEDGAMAVQKTIERNLFAVPFRKKLGQYRFATALANRAIRAEHGGVKTSITLEQLTSHLEVMRTLPGK
jgi:hypothetical protein